MDESVYYTRVGFFLCLMLLAIVALAYLFQFNRAVADYKPYVIYVKEAVAGLSPKSQVKYNGVTVGFVEDLALDKTDLEKVRILIQVKKGTPVQKTTSATLKLQGITGIAYIELKKSDPEKIQFTSKEKERIPEIGYEPSFIAYINETLKTVTDSVVRLSNQFELLLDPHNLANYRSILDSLQKASKELPSTLKEAKSTLLRIQQTLTSLTPRVNQTLENTVQLSETLKTIGLAIERNPSILLRGRPPLPLGPGEG